MSRTTAIKLAVVLSILIAAVATLAAGGFDALGDQDRVEGFFSEAGVWGPLVYILAFVALQPLSLPGAVLIIPATFVWPWWEVTIYTIAGGMVASTAGFVFARWLAQDWIRRRLPDRLRPWEQRLADHGFIATVALRLITGYAPAADWALGASRVSTPAFLAGTFIGLIPGTIAIAVWGDEAVRGFGDAPSLSLGIVAVVGLIGVVLYRLRQRALESE